MSPIERSLSCDIVDIYNTHLGPHYAQLKHDLDNSLQGNGGETSPAEAIVNVGILRDIVSVLPVVNTQHEFGRAVLTPEPSIARWTQASVLQPLDYSHVAPCEPIAGFIIGARRNKKTVDVLLQNMDCVPRKDVEKPDAVLKLLEGIPRREYEMVQENMAKLKSMPMTESELSNAIVNGQINVHALALNYYSERKRSKALRPTDGITTVGAISNETLSRFEVYDYIAQLAVGFGRVAEVKTILQATRTSEGKQTRLGRLEQELLSRLQSSQTQK